MDEKVLAAIIGLAGSIVGGVLVSGANWLLKKQEISAQRERDERQHEREEKLRWFQNVETVSKLVTSFAMEMAGYAEHLGKIKLGEMDRKDAALLHIAETKRIALLGADIRHYLGIYIPSVLPDIDSLVRNFNTLTQLGRQFIDGYPDPMPLLQRCVDVANQADVLRDKLNGTLHRYLGNMPSEFIVDSVNGEGE
jgi:hypothetical protein